jgi:hypothetical protein
VATESASKILSIDGLFLSISYPVDSDSFKGWIQRFPAGSRFEITGSQNSKKVNSEDPNREYQAETDDTWSLQEIEAGAQADHNECNAEEPNLKHLPGTQLGISVPIGLRAISG